MYNPDAFPGSGPTCPTCGLIAALCQHAGFRAEARKRMGEWVEKEERERAAEKGREDGTNPDPKTTR